MILKICLREEGVIVIVTFLTRFFSVLELVCSICQIWIDSIFYRSRYFAKLPYRYWYRYRYFPKSPYRYRYFWNCLIDIDIDIDIFQNCLIDIDIFQKCWYIDNRYVISIYRTGLGGVQIKLLKGHLNTFRIKGANGQIWGHIAISSQLELILFCFWSVR